MSFSILDSEMPQTGCSAVNHELPRHLKPTPFQNLIIDNTRRHRAGPGQARALTDFENERNFERVQ